MSTPTPPPKQVEAFHKYDDTDNEVNSHHHTIGITSKQAAAGNHISHPLSAQLVGSKASFNPTLINSIIAALVELGAKDGTT